MDPIHKFIRESLPGCVLAEKGNPCLPLARRLKLTAGSPMRELSPIDALEAFLEYLDGKAFNGTKTDFLKAWNDAKIPEGCRPLVEAVERTRIKRDRGELLTFPSRTARRIPKYNLLLNIIRELRELTPADEDLFLSTRALAREVKEAGIAIGHYTWIGFYLTTAISDGFLEMTKKHIPGRKSRRFHYNDPFPRDSEDMHNL